MSDVQTIENNEVVFTPEERRNIRQHIIHIEKLLSKVDGHTVGDSESCPLKHSFCDGMYVREIKIPKDTILTGKIHKHEHPNFLMSGTVMVITESGGEEILHGPLSMISEAGTKRALYAVTDLVWITIHLNPKNTRDLEELEELVIAKDFETYDKFKSLERSPIRRFKDFLIKRLQ